MYVLRRARAITLILVLLEARVARGLRLGDLALVDEVELDLRRVDGVGVSAP